MTEEELKKLAKEYQDGLDEIEQIRQEQARRFEGLTEEEFEKELEKQLEEMLEDARRNPIQKILKDYDERHNNKKTWEISGFFV